LYFYSIGIVTLCERPCSAPVESRLFWGRLAKVEIGNVSFLMSVRPHGMTRLLIDGFSGGLEGFAKICRENSILVKVGQK
jgi:hypothetical protein